MTYTDMIYNAVRNEPDRIWTPKDIADRVWPDLPPSAWHSARSIVYTRMRVLERWKVVKKVSGYNEQPSRWVYTGKMGVWE